jgi:aminoglycoside phosphotransferase (APT) family kinase protein
VSEDTPLRERLEAYYRRIDKDFQISNFTPISDGWETEVYSFTLVRKAAEENLILRMYPGRDWDAAFKCRVEYRDISKLSEAGYPVPKVFLHETDKKWLGKPFIIMQKIEGRPLGDVMRDDIARQPELLTRFVQLAIDLHKIDYCLFADPCNDFDTSVVLPALLLRWRKVMVEDTKQAWAVPILDWLETYKTNVLPSPKISPVHNDLHPHNVLITPDDQLYVIDWSGFSVGDYRTDLAWTLLLISSSGYPQLRDIILSEYARLAGQPVENIEYFDVLAALRRLVDLAVSLGSGAEVQGMRPETVAIMRTQQDRYQYVYGLLRDRTGLRVPYLEDLIASLSE